MQGDTMKIRPYRNSDKEAVVALHYTGLGEAGVNKGLARISYRFRGAASDVLQLQN
jgi:hypothetical protein